MWIFHDWQHGSKEAVDTYMQESHTGDRGNGQNLPAGLRPKLKSKVVGSKGSLEQLLTKARFDKELAALKSELSPPRKPGGSSPKSKAGGPPEYPSAEGGEGEMATAFSTVV